MEASDRAAVIEASAPIGRPIPEVVAELRARASDAVMDDDFARDIEAGIEEHREPWSPAFWAADERG
jgi:non-canonical (house-cleaning) NTP pyrophosphatase